jgi:NAD(P)-dependent dehydrogenase (short-subunit alcohol dehydrogenase family)
LSDVPEVPEVPDRSEAGNRKSVLITGASSGLGAAMAERMVARGWRVFGTSRKVQASSDSIEWIEMDVCDDASVESALANVFTRTARLDGLVCNAGYGIYGSIEETPLERARAQFETNLFGVLRVLTPVVRRMREQNAGRILLVGSLSGRSPIPFQAHYSATKAAIESISFALVNELDPYDIDISLIEPGDINTAFNDVMDWGDADASSPYAEASARCEKSIRESLPRSPGPKIVADAVEHALTARKPRLRYAVGNEAMLVGLGKRLLSDRLSLRLIRNHFGI